LPRTAEKRRGGGGFSYAAGHKNKGKKYPARKRGNA